MKKLVLAALVALAACQAQPAVAEMNPLNKVQERVNLTLKFQPEAEGKDVWKIPTRYADCEDYALLKRKILIEEYGFTDEDVQILLILRPVEGKKNVKEGHAVLYVKSKDMVLDNPPAEDTRQNLKPIPMADYIAKGNKVHCVFGDISTDRQYKKVTDRCVK